MCNTHNFVTVIHSKENMWVTRKASIYNAYYYIWAIRHNTIWQEVLGLEFESSNFNVILSCNKTLENLKFTERKLISFFGVSLERKLKGKVGQMNRSISIYDVKLKPLKYFLKNSLIILLKMFDCFSPLPLPSSWNSFPILDSSHMQKNEIVCLKLLITSVSFGKMFCFPWMSVTLL